MSSQTFTVSGMTCAHCVHAVRVEFSSLPGVTAVAVDLATGTVTVDSERPIDSAEAAAAADKAGYELAS
jgi:copper chaperone